MKILVSLLVMAGILSLSSLPAAAADKFVTDVFKTNAGDLQITFIGHGTLMLAYGDKIIHIDPFNYRVGIKFEFSCKSDELEFIYFYRSIAGKPVAA